MTFYSAKYNISSDLLKVSLPDIFLGPTNKKRSHFV